MTNASNAVAGETGARAGALLRAAREAAGLSVEAVAQQLKLSPRQVRALEGDDFGSLPGRTFVRGFVRNYARLVALDTERVLDALPSAADTLEAPALHATAPTMGELPTAEAPKARWTRWAIPASLAAVVAVAAVYEWARPAAASRAHPAAKEATATSAPPNSRPMTPSAEKNETPLANPLSGSAPVAAPSAEAPSPAVTPPSTEPAQPKGPANAS
jgi:cytoskeleton protein RodZ